MVQICFEFLKTQTKHRLSVLHQQSGSFHILTIDIPQTREGQFDQLKRTSSSSFVSLVLQHNLHQKSFHKRLCVCRLKLLSEAPVLSHPPVSVFLVHSEQNSQTNSFQFVKAGVV